MTPIRENIEHKPIQLVRIDVGKTSLEYKRKIAQLADTHIFPSIAIITPIITLSVKISFKKTIKKLNKDITDKNVRYAR